MLHATRLLRHYAVGESMTVAWPDFAVAGQQVELWGIMGGVHSYNRISNSCVIFLRRPASSIMAPCQGFHTF